MIYAALLLKKRKGRYIMTRTYHEDIYRWPSYDAYNRGEATSFSCADREWDHSVRWHIHVPPLDNIHLFIIREELGAGAAKSVIVEDC